MMDHAEAPTAAHDLADRFTALPHAPEQIAFQEAFIADISHSLLGRWWMALRVGIAKLTWQPRPVPFWVAVLCVSLINLGLTASLAAVFGETTVLELKTFGKLTFWVGFTALFVSMMQWQLNASVQLFNTTVLESLMTVDEIMSLRRFLARMLDWRWQLVCCFGYCISVALLCTYLAFSVAGNGFPISATVLYVINFFQIGMYSLFVVVFIAVFPRLQMMNVQMYQGDPSASPVVHRLYRVSTRFMFAIAFLSALFIFLAAYLDPDVSNNHSILIWTAYFIFAWFPILTLFVVTHTTLGGMIRRSKMAKLTALQELIDRTERESNMTDKTAVESITRLMDYHDRIKAYPNSLVDGRTVRNLITSLILPLLGAVLGSITTIIDLWHKLVIP